MRHTRIILTLTVLAAALLFISATQDKTQMRTGASIEPMPWPPETLIVRHIGGTVFEIEAKWIKSPGMTKERALSTQMFGVEPWPPDTMPAPVPPKWLGKELKLVTHQPEVKGR